MSGRRLAPTTVLVSLVLAGCSPPARPTLSHTQLAERTKVYTDSFNSSLERANTRLVKRFNPSPELPALEPPALNFLAISGGGDYGAFGAGFLVGWGQTPDTATRRPSFDVVTGVSTGALIAPFAFVGTDNACRLVESFYRNPQSDWVESRGWFFFLPQNPSFMRIPGLERDIRKVISPEFVRQIAAQYETGRTLAIGSTDLDLGRQQIWNLGEEAQAALGGDRERITRILLSSAAIPGVFPPVEIGGSMYADGGVTANVLVRLDPRSPAGFVHIWKREHPDTPLPKIRYWVIFNNQLSHPPRTVQSTWPAIIGPCLATSIRHASIAELRWLAAQADFVNATMKADIEVRVVSIPNNWRPPVEGDFKKETMASLADLGRAIGADPASWRVWASPQTAMPELPDDDDSFSPPPAKPRP